MKQTVASAASAAYQPYVPPAVLVVEPRHWDRVWGVIAIALVVYYGGWHG